MPRKKPKSKGRARDEDVIRAVDVEDDEEYTSDEGGETEVAASPPTKRKQVKTATQPKRKKRAVYNAPDESQPAEHLTQLSNAGLDKIWLTQDHRTVNLNRLTSLVKDHGLMIKANRGLKYQPQAAGTLQHVKDLPVYKGRNFVLQDHLVALYTVERELDGTSTQAWNLVAHDEDSGETVELFRSPPYTARQASRFSQNNAIDINVCPTQQRAIDLGRCAVQVMNRVPAKLDTKVWASARTIGKKPAPKIYRFSHVRTFVDITAFLMWDPGFDFGLLHSAFFHHASVAQTFTATGTQSVPRWGAYGNPLLIQQQTKHKHSVSVKTTTLALQIDKPYDPPLGYIGVALADVDAQRVIADTTLPVPHGFHFRGNDPDPNQPAGHDPGDLKVRACVTLVHRIFYDLVGMVGSRQQIYDTVEDYKRRFAKQGSITTTRSHHAEGSINGSRLFSLPRSRDTRYVVIPLQTKIAKLLDTSKIPATTVEGVRGALAVTVDSPHRLSHAYVMQQGYDAVAAGKNLVNVLLEASQAADALNIGLIKAADVIAFFHSFDASRMSETEVICNHCYRPRLLIELGWVADRLLCISCSKLTGVSSSGYMPASWASTINTSLMALVLHETKLHDVTWDAKLQLNTILRTHEVTSDSYMDGYDGQVIASDTLAVDTPTRTPTGHRVSHPFSPSIDAVHRRWQAKDAFHLHHPDNCVVTKVCLNLMKGNHSPAALPVLQRSHALFEIINSRSPVVGYHDEIMDGMQIVELACDNIYIIDLLVPWKRKIRITQTPLLTDKQYKDKFIAQQKSGSWDGTPLTVSAERTTFSSRADLCRWASKAKPHGQNFEMWTEEEVEILLSDVEQMESDVLNFNPHQLKIPRCRDGRTPCLWISAHVPDDMDMEFMFREFEARLWTWDEWCNEKNETVESPATLFIEYVAQWLITGGKCHIFGFIMTYATAHLCVYAFTRAVTALDEDGTQREVFPGEIMRSGCLALLPRNMKKDYDVRRRTVIVESSAANRLRHNYLGGTGLIDQLRQGIRNIATSCQHFGPVLSHEQYRDVPKLASWRTKSGMVQKLDPSEIDLAVEWWEDPDFEAEDVQLSDFDNISKDDSVTVSSKESEDAVEGETTGDVELSSLA